MLAKVGNKDSQSVIQALIKQSHKLHKELYRSLTWDRGVRWPSIRNSPQRRRSTSSCSCAIPTASSRQISLQSPPRQCVATRLRRKYEPLATTVFSKGHLFVAIKSIQTQRRRQTAQRTTAYDAGIRNSRRAFQCMCRVAQLRAPRIADVRCERTND
jgi:hypothetical protein